MTNSKLVTLTLATASFLVNGETDKELLENAKKAMAEQLSRGDFPQITYGINDPNALTFDNVLPGLIVESKDGKVGIVTGVNKKTINVTYNNHVSVQGSPHLFKKSDVPFEQARSKRRDASITVDMWMEGESGYLNNKGEIHKVVIGKTTRDKTKVHVVNSSSSYSIPEKNLSHFIKDELEQVK
ncbi:MAG: hypothetical protein R3250_03320 [Melioribacteraceae bacterium]|nr:hypothetical protein [Melioribacteraceae bacterium]